jgi:hypothetical protein
VRGRVVAPFVAIKTTPSWNRHGAERTRGALAVAP